MSLVGDCPQATEDTLQSPGVRAIGGGGCSNGEIVHVRENLTFRNLDVKG